MPNIVQIGDVHGCVYGYIPAETHGYAGGYEQIFNLDPR